MYKLNKINLGIFIILIQGCASTAPYIMFDGEWDCISKFESPSGIIKEGAYSSIMNSRNTSAVTWGESTFYIKTTPNLRIVYQYEIMSQYILRGDTIRVLPSDAKITAIIRDDLGMQKEFYRTELEKGLLFPIEAKFEFKDPNKIAYGQQDVQGVNFCKRVKNA